MSTSGRITGRCGWHVWANEFVKNEKTIEAQHLSEFLASQLVAAEVEGGGIVNASALGKELVGLSFNAGPDSTRICKAFSSPSANVLIKTNDNVIFRIHDYYLQAAG